MSEPNHQESPARLPHPRRPVGYVTVLRGNLAEALTDEPTKRRHVLPDEQPRRWAPPDRELLERVLAGLNRL